MYILFDRFLRSSWSVTVRAWSNCRVASGAILCIILVVGLTYIYVPIQYQLKQTARRCPANQNNPPAFNGIWNLIVFSLGPSIVMLIFGLLTVQHVRVIIRRVAPQNMNSEAQLRVSFPPPSQRQKTKDRHLTRMMIIQCVYFSLLSAPVSVYWLYISFKSDVVSDPLQTAKDDLFSNVAGYLSITCACTSFYLFTVSSRIFRRELIRLFKIRVQLNPNIILNQRNARQRNQIMMS